MLWAREAVFVVLSLPWRVTSRTIGGFVRLPLLPVIGPLPLKVLRARGIARGRTSRSRAPYAERWPAAATRTALFTRAVTG